MSPTMKKVCFILAACAGTAATAYAYQTINGATSIGSLGFTPSNNVYIAVNSTDIAYTTESLHLKGSRIFITDSVETKFYFQDATFTTDATADFGTMPTASTTSGQHGTPNPTSGGWTSM